jgi:tetratricopeptide (TPR) repeat protein
LLVGAAAILTAIQLIPLPPAIVRLLSPVGAGIYADAAQGSGLPGSGWIPVTLDAPNTLIELAKLISYFAIAWVTLRMANRRRGRRRLIALVAIAAALLSIIALTHNALDEKRLFGIYTPLIYSPRYLGPLINPNHLAGYLAMGACVSIGLALAAKELRGQVLWGCSSALSGGVSLLIGSRGAAVALMLGLATIVGLGVIGHRRRAARGQGGSARQPPRVWAVLGLSLAIAAVVVLFTAGSVTRDLLSTSTNELTNPESKFGAWKSAAGMTLDYPVLGIGRGAFEPVFTGVHVSSNERIYSHVENEYLQAVVDWGYLGVSLLLAAFALLLRLIWRQWDGRAWSLGAAGGLVVLAAHGTVDFGLELPGVALSAILLLGALSRPDLTKLATDAHRRIRASRAIAVGLALLVVMAAASPVGRTLRDDRLDLSASLASDGIAIDEIASRANAFQRRHPADYYGAALAARALYERRSRTAFRYANHALKRHPTHPGTHHLVARMLLAAGRGSQAAIEYSLAIKFSENPVAIVEEVGRVFGDATLAARALPNVRTAPFLLNRLVRAGRSDIAVIWGTTLLSERPGDKDLPLPIARAALAIGDTELATRMAVEAHRGLHSLETARLLTSVWDGAGKTDAADQVLLEFARDSPKPSEQGTVLALLGARQLEQGHLAQARETFTVLLEIPTLDKKKRIEAHNQLARVERQLGNTHRAAWEESRARDLAR